MLCFAKIHAIKQQNNDIILNLIHALWVMTYIEFIHLKVINPETMHIYVYLVNGWSRLEDKG